MRFCMERGGCRSVEVLIVSNYLQPIRCLGLGNKNVGFNLLAIQDGEGVNGGVLTMDFQMQMGAGCQAGLANLAEGL